MSPLAPALHIVQIPAAFTFLSDWPWLLGALAIVLLISGLEDLVPVTICFVHELRHAASNPSNPAAESPAFERSIAIFVPCWRESAVIGNMVRHNLAAIRYRNFELFLGVYPNDEATVQVANELAANFRNVHVAACPHPGPTSKADCLNWIYQRMLLWEKEQHACVDTVVLHDAEDLIHPEALQLINRERATYAMVQVPVLPIPTPLGDLTHGIYCDEFAEFQFIDMRARQFSSSFIPSNGVGTGFAREILDHLARERQNRIFNPASLTEDYEIGVYIHQSGYPQWFVPLQRGEKDFIVTREFFPAKIHSAIRQRTRWVTGIALQGWERDRWRGSWRTRYWFFRDRKGLLTNPLSLLTNMLFVAGAADWVESALAHRPWAFAISNPTVLTLCWLTFWLQCLRVALRMTCVTRLFGFTFACGVPFRIVHANFINTAASLAAVLRFAKSRWQGHPLVWIKTEHVYPGREALETHHRELEEVLVSSGFLSDAQLAALRSRIPRDADLADFLLASGTLSDEDLCQAISLQCGLRSTRVDARDVKTRVARTLPVHVQKRFGIVPFRVHEGRLHVAGIRAPSPVVFEELKSFTQLPVEFQLVTRENYQKLQSLL